MDSEIYIRLFPRESFWETWSFKLNISPYILKSTSGVCALPWQRVFHV